MKFDDIKTIAEVQRLSDCRYWVGSRQAYSRGDYNKLRPVLVLAKGRYVEYIGECGPAVYSSDKVSASRLVVATWRKLWSAYRPYDSNTWEPRVIQASIILLSDAEYRERVRLQAADKRRHEQARAEVKKQREAVHAEIIEGLGLNGLSKFASLYVNTRYQYGTRKGSLGDPIEKLVISLDIPVAAVKRHLTPEGRDALKRLQQIKDPAC
jgi:hypothetical protein